VAGEEEKKEEKEAFEVGRILGVVARRNPELYRALKELTELEGVKLTDLIEDALQMYIEYKIESSFMPKQVFYAMKLIERVSRWLVVSMGEMMKLMISLTSALVGLAPGEEEKESGKKSMPADLRAKMVELFTPLLQVLVTALLSATAKPLAATPAQQVAQQQKVKVVSSKKEPQSG